LQDAASLERQCLQKRQCSHLLPHQVFGLEVSGSLAAAVRGSCLR
jgi:hypothetical protein